MLSCETQKELRQETVQGLPDTPGTLAEETVQDDRISERDWQGGQESGCLNRRRKPAHIETKYLVKCLKPDAWGQKIEY